MNFKIIKSADCSLDGHQLDKYKANSNLLYVMPIAPSAASDRLIDACNMELGALSKSFFLTHHEPRHAPKTYAKTTGQGAYRIDMHVCVCLGNAHNQLVVEDSLATCRAGFFCAASDLDTVTACLNQLATEMHMPLALSDERPRSRSRP